MILFYSPQFLPSVGGLQNIIHYWAGALTGMGKKVVVITRTKNRVPDAFPYEVIRNASLMQTFRLCSQADQIIMFNIALKAWPLWLSGRRKIVVNHQTSLFPPDGSRPLRQLLKQWIGNHWVHRNIACSQFIAAEYRNAVVLHNPYNENVFKPMHLDRKPCSFLFVGRLVSDKGADLLLQAFHQLRRQRQEATLTIIGDGPDRLQLEHMVRSLHMVDFVDFAGAKGGAEIAGIMNRHEVLVVPSRMEPFGIVVLEGLACGCQVICSNQGGLPEAAGGMATLFDNGNAEDLLNKMLAVLEPGARKEISSHGLQHLQEHSAQHTAAKLLHLLT